MTHNRMIGVSCVERVVESEYGTSDDEDEDMIVEGQEKEAEDFESTQVSPGDIVETYMYLRPKRYRVPVRSIGVQCSGIDCETVSDKKNPTKIKSKPQRETKTSKPRSSVKQLKRKNSGKKMHLKQKCPAEGCTKQIIWVGEHLVKFHKLDTESVLYKALMLRTGQKTRNKPVKDRGAAKNRKTRGRQQKAHK